MRDAPVARSLTQRNPGPGSPAPLGPRTRRSVVLALAVLLAFVGGAVATPPPSRPGPPPNLPPTQAMDLLRAEQALRGGDAAKALLMYRKLWEGGVRDARVMLGVGESLLLLGRHEELDELRERQGENPWWGPWLYLLSGEARAREELPEEAVALWRQAVELAPPVMKLSLLEEITALERRHGMMDEHLSTLAEARELAGDPAAYAREFAEAYEATGDLPGAIEELLLLVEGNPGERFRVEQSLYRILRELPSLRRAATEELLSSIKRHPDHVGLRELLVNVLLDGGECDQALEEAILREEAQPTQGAFLLTFAEGAQRSGCPGTALETYRSIRRRYPRGPLGPAVELGLARQLDLAGETARAAEAYRGFAEERPGAREAPSAMERAAELLLGLPGGGSEALDLFQELAGRYPATDQGREAPFGAIEALLVIGRLGEAETRLDEMLASEITEEVTERAHFLKGRVLYLSEELESAEEELTLVVNEHPRGSTVNDCLELLLLLSRRSEGADDLRRLARAERLALRGERTAAEGDLILLAEASPPGPFWVEAELRLAALEREAGDPRQALARLAKVIEKAEGDIGRARALKETGDILWLELGDPAEARHAYERLLVECPDTHLTDKVRRSLEELRRSVP